MRECATSRRRLDLSADWMKREDTDGRYKELYDDIEMKRPTNMLYVGTSSSRQHRHIALGKRHIKVS